MISTVAMIRALTATGAVFCSLAVALGAYASHAVSGEAQHHLALAALFLFGHGLALAALAPRAQARLTQAALALLLLGVLLFSGTLIAAAFLGASTALAPAGGTLLILGWLVYAAASLRF